MFVPNVPRQESEVDFLFAPAPMHIQLLLESIWYMKDHFKVEMSLCIRKGPFKCYLIKIFAYLPYNQSSVYMKILKPQCLSVLAERAASYFTLLLKSPCLDKPNNSYFIS